jgi:hypothetical protein
VRDERWAGACFVLGPHRSGTTILTRCLAASGAFVYLSAADIVAFHRGADQVEPTLGRLVERKETRGIDRTLLSEDLTEEYGFLLPDRRLSEETAPLVASVHEELAARRGGGRRFLLRNPWDLGRAPLIHRLFPGAVFVFTVRDPVDTIDSQVRAARSLYGAPSEYHALLSPSYRRHAGRPRRFALYRWAISRGGFVFMLLREFRLSTGRWLGNLDDLPRDRWTVVRYEDLIREPEAELARVYGFLGLPPAGVPALAQEIRPRDRALDPDVRARIPWIRRRTRRYRERFGY